MSALCRFGVEAGRAIPTTQYRAAEIVIAEGEHADVLVERTAPRNDLIELEHEYPDSLWISGVCRARSFRT